MFLFLANSLSFFIQLKLSSLVRTSAFSPNIFSEMGCFEYNGIFCYGHQQFAISFLILLISSSSHLILFTSQGRELKQTAEDSQTASIADEKAVFRAEIGSRPPRCNRRCRSCEHCEAVQVPTPPQIRGSENRNSTRFSVVAYARGEDYSNYKPMSWKCKCGNLIINP